MSKLSGRITAVLMIIFIFSFLILTVIEKKSDKSVSENRSLAPMPHLSLESLSDGSYGRELEAYMADHFAYRDKWVSAKAKIESDMCENIVNGVYVGDDRLLDADISKRHISEKNVNAINKFTKNYSGTVYFTAVPTSSGVYGDVLPEYLLSNTEKNQIDCLYSSLNESIRKIDTYNILKMLNESYIYYRNDTKLTSYGAYYVYRTVIQKLGFQPSAYDKYTIKHITSDFRGNLYSRCLYNGTKSDIIDIYSYAGGAETTSCTAYKNNGVNYRKTLNDTDFLESGNMYRMYLGEEVPFIKIKTSVNNEKKLLLIKDSYADCFIQFLIQHYSEIAVISPEHMEKNINYFVDPNNYEQALFLFGIDSMNNEKLFEMINK
ncbi:MAG: hypothetical protein K2I06_13195 [Ruminococcus sp.]|nr:hypothetical protein [Ruminococcus sp.]